MTVVLYIIPYLTNHIQVSLSQSPWPLKVAGHGRGNGQFTILNSVLTASIVVNYHHRPIIITICYMYWSTIVVNYHHRPIIITIYYMYWSFISIEVSYRDKPMFICTVKMWNTNCFWEHEVVQFSFGYKLSMKGR